jgi:hypothetical protein
MGNNPYHAAHAFHLAHDAADELLDLILIHRPFAQGYLKRTLEFFTIEKHAAAAPLQDHEFS